MKKYILFIVEGKNDQIEIQAMLRAYCAEKLSTSYVDMYLPYNGDITIDCTEKTIVGTLNDLVIKWRKGESKPFHPVSPSDVAKIVHVIDTDGTFIADDAIVSADVGNPEYTPTSIKCGNRDFIVQRNKKKAKVLRKLLSVKTIDNIPYELYFVSCNMDHVLFNTQNPKSVAKGPNARIFAARCKTADALNESVFASSVKYDGSYPDSWEFIQLAYNSLHRHTNFNILLDSMAETSINNR